MTAIRMDSDLRAGRFLAGVARKRWRLVSNAFPGVLIEIATRDGRWVCIRFECTGYPNQGPTATPWNTATNSVLPPHQWPKGGRVSKVFNPGWNPNALYIPCDRVAIQGHSAWFDQHPELIWNPERGIVMYLEALSEVLQSHELQTAA